MAVALSPGRLGEGRKNGLVYIECACVIIFRILFAYYVNSTHHVLLSRPYMYDWSEKTGLLTRLLCFVEAKATRLFRELLKTATATCSRLPAVPMCQDNGDTETSASDKTQVTAWLVSRGLTLLEISYTFDEIFRNPHRNPEILAEIHVLKSLSHCLLLY